MVANGVTERLLPVPTNIPPQEALYHLITSPSPPPPPVNVIIAFCPLQIVDGVAVAEVGPTETLFTVIVTDAQLLLTEHGAPVSYLPK